MARKKTVEPAYVSEDTIEDIPVVQRLQAIAVEPGDLLVVTVPQGLPRETVMAAGRAVEAAVSGKNVRVLLTYPDFDIKLFRIADLEPGTVQLPLEFEQG